MSETLTVKKEIVMLIKVLDEVSFCFAVEEPSKTGGSPFSKPFAKASPRERALFDISVFEDRRKESNDSTMGRNELYWNELMKMQDEAIADSEQLILYMKSKHAVISAFAHALNSIPTEVSGKAKPISEAYALNPGIKARQQLVNLDKLWSEKMFSMTDSLENDIIKPLEAVHQAFIDEVKAMSRQVLFQKSPIPDLKFLSYKFYFFLIPCFKCLFIH